MTQNFNFDTNIEKRMPTTGKVFMVDRMTSDYAVSHPFNVDAFIEEVFLKYEQMAADDPRNFGHVVRNREQLRRLWNLVLQMPERGDATLYPNNNGRMEPALMEVWHKAGDYWRVGFRLGDQLPAIVPGHKITRLGDGEWIALFPKDMHLLVSPTLSEEDYSVRQRCNMVQNEINSRESETERAAACSSCSGKEMRNGDSLSCAITDSTEGAVPSVSTRRQRRERRLEQNIMSLHTSPAITVDQSDEDHSNRNMKIFAAVATAVVFVVLVNTIGLFGIAALGLLAGGLIK